MKYFLYVLLLAALVLPAYAIEPTPKTAEETSSATLYVIKADEIITQSTAERVKEAVKQASEDKNGYLLIELNTPGTYYGKLCTCYRLCNSIRSKGSLGRDVYSPCR